MQFDFGQNWADFSANAVTQDRLKQAREDFKDLIRGIELRDRSFLDIGFGQGFSLLSAQSLGARVVGCDINPRCGEVLRRNEVHFDAADIAKIDTVIGSILDDHVVARVREHAPDKSGYHIVHSWGVLHHTGNMRRAIANAASLVRPRGHFVIAIYNRHWSSLPWLCIKWLYSKSPGWVQRVWIGSMYPVIWVAKWLVTGSSPSRMERGMDFYYNVVDWVGGYPYEYGSITEIEQLVIPLGFDLVRSRHATVPTGCNELIFVRRGEPPA